MSVCESRRRVALAGRSDRVADGLSTRGAARDARAQTALCCSVVPTRKEAGRRCSAARGRRSRGSSCAVPGRRRGGARRPPWRACSRRAAARWRRAGASSAGRIAMARGTRPCRSCIGLASVSVQTRNATGTSDVTVDRRRARHRCFGSGRRHWRRAHACFRRNGTVGPTRSTRPALLPPATKTARSCSRRRARCGARTLAEAHPVPSCDAGTNPCRRQSDQVVAPWSERAWRAGGGRLSRWRRRRAESVPIELEAVPHVARSRGGRSRPGRHLMGRLIRA